MRYAKFSLVLTLSTLALSACSNDIIGKWARSDTYSNGLSTTITLNIEAEKLTVTMTCGYPDGSSLSAIASSTAEVTSSEVIQKESISAKAVSGGRTCELSTSANTSTYEVDETTLKLTSIGVTTTYGKVN